MTRPESESKITQSVFLERRLKTSFVAKAKLNFEKAKVIKDIFVSIYRGFCVTDKTVKSYYKISIESESGLFLKQGLQRAL